MNHISIVWAALWPMYLHVPMDLRDDNFSLSPDF